MSRLSLIMLTYNSQRRLQSALESAQWADEIIIIDSGSTDRTLDICRPFATRIIQDNTALRDPSLNFDVLRNLGIEAAQYEWTFVLDSDEIISLGLMQELQQVIRDGKFPVWKVPRINYFFGHRVRLLDPDYQIRLFRSRAVRYDGPFLHRQPVSTEGPVGELQEKLIHFNQDSWSQFLEKSRRYRKNRAHEILRTGDGKPLSPLLSALRLFNFYYFQQKSFRDGFWGLWVSFLYARNEFLAAKLVQKDKTLAEK